MNQSDVQKKVITIIIMIIMIITIIKILKSLKCECNVFNILPRSNTNRSENTGYPV